VPTLQGKAPETAVRPAGAGCGHPRGALPPQHRARHVLDRHPEGVRDRGERGRQRAGPGQHRPRERQGPQRQGRGRVGVQARDIVGPGPHDVRVEAAAARPDPE